MGEKNNDVKTSGRFAHTLNQGWNQAATRVTVNGLTDACVLSGIAAQNQVLHQAWKTLADADKGHTVLAVGAIGIAGYVVLRVINEIREGREGTASGPPVDPAHGEKNFYRRIYIRTKARSQFLLQPTVQGFSAALMIPVALSALGHDPGLDRTAALFTLKAIGNSVYVVNDETGEHDKQMHLIPRAARRLATNPWLWWNASFMYVGGTEATRDLPSAVANICYITAIAQTFMNSIAPAPNDNHVVRNKYSAAVDSFIHDPATAPFLTMMGAAASMVEQAHGDLTNQFFTMSLFTATCLSLFAKSKWGGVWQGLDKLKNTIAPGRPPKPPTGNRTLEAPGVL
ncbi:MAG TPA: hypothetical protein VFR09_00225 [Alphaproteobacteria bacterium]|nr:hypothetical protein [Alphaproteobacteria bacterium]